MLHCWYRSFLSRLLFQRHNKKKQEFEIEISQDLLISSIVFLIHVKEIGVVADELEAHSWIKAARGGSP